MTAHIAEQSPDRARQPPRSGDPEISTHQSSRVEVPHALGIVQLIERDAEVAHIDHGLNDLANGTGSLIVIDGPLGIGRSSLLSAACERAARRDFAVIDTRATVTEQRFEFSILRELLQHAVVISERDGAAERGLATPTTGNAPNDVQCRGEEEVLSRFQRTICTIADRRPVVLAIDDVHWADEPSLTAVGYLARRVRHCPILVLVSSRTGACGGRSEALDDLLDNPDAGVMTLSPLSDDAVHELIRRRIDPSADREFSSQCHAATGGIPLLVHEALAGMRAAGIAPVAANALIGLDAASRAIGALALARLRRCSLAALALAEAVAVLGADSGYRLAADVADISYEAAAIATEALIDVGIFAQSRSLAFAQPLVRDAVLVSTNPARLDELHYSAARLFHERGAPLEIVVKHVLVTEPRSEEWIVSVLHTAAERALRAAQHDHAVTLLRRALAEPPGAADAPRLHNLLGSIEADSGQPQGLARLRAVAEEADPEVRADAALVCGRLLTLAGEPGQALELLRRVRAEVGLPAHAAGPLEWLISANELSCTATVRAGRERLAKLIAADPEGRDPHAQAARALLASVRAGGRCDALRNARTAIDVLDPIESDPVAVSFALCAITWSDHPELAETLLDQMEAHATQRGWRLVAALALAHRAHILLRRGRVPEARRAAMRSLEDVRGDAWSTQAQAYPAAFLVDALVAEGDLETAAHTLASANLSGGLADHWSNNFVLASRGRLRLAQDDGEGARRDLEECARRMRAWGVDNPAVIPWRSLLAASLVRTGDLDAASALATEELELAQEFGAPRTVGIALHAASMTQGTRGLLQLDEAVQTLRTADAPLDLAAALADLGTVVSGTGRKRDAREPLREALDLASRCGATALQERTHTELLNSGARPRRIEATGVAALTPRERRVSQLAAEGLTNKRIAEAMFLSEKTIELHLRNTYEKLSIAGRSALSRALVGVEVEGEAIAS
jgi:DNA-binding CsgD family transcriptional regulator